MPEHTQPPDYLDPRDVDFSYHSSAGARNDTYQRVGVALPQDGILLIEDNEDDAELSLRALHKLGLSLPILWLSDSARAVKALEAAPNAAALPRLILLDLKMPRVDGFEVLQRLKANAQTREIAVIVMASSPRAPELPRCFSLGANAFVVKPLQRESLLAACERAMLDLPLS